MSTTLISPEAILDWVLKGRRVSGSEALVLLEQAELPDLAVAASAVRDRHNDPARVSYVIDRNVNYTDVCNVYCTFCAFYHKPGDSRGYVLTKEQLKQKAEETKAIGGTGFLLQGGVNPDLPWDYYLDLVRYLQHDLGIWVHGFSPVEIQMMAKLSGQSLGKTIADLREAGLGSIPGGGAEILVDRIRKKVAPLKGGRDKWLEVMEAAHEEGVKTTGTMMFGITETLAERIEHFEVLRDQQDRAMARNNGGGYTAFAAWPFQSGHTPWEGKVPKPTDVEYLRTIAVARIFLDNFAHIQSSWVTMGRKTGQLALHYGCDDMGSLMLEENVVSAAGTCYSVNQDEMTRMIRAAGYEPWQRDNIYEPVPKPPRAATMPGGMLIKEGPAGRCGSSFKGADAEERPPGIVPPGWGGGGHPAASGSNHVDPLCSSRLSGGTPPGAPSAAHGGFGTGSKGPLTELVLSTLIVQDLLAILMLALLTAVGSGAGLTLSALLFTVGRLAGFLVVVMALARWILPPFIRRVADAGNAETLLVTVIGLCFTFSLLAFKAGYSVALGAFLAGMVVAESGRERMVEHLVHPLRDVFVAVFFVSIGMQIDPSQLLPNWKALLVVGVLVLLGKILSGALGGLLSGNSLRNSIRAGAGLAQIGEFSFIIVALGQSLGVVGPALFPVLAATCAWTTLSTPLLIRHSEGLADHIERWLPRRIRHLLLHHRAAMGHLRNLPFRKAAWRHLRRPFGYLVLDSFLVTLAGGLGALVHRALTHLLETRGLSHQLAVALVWLLVGGLALRFFMGILKQVRKIARAIAERAIQATGNPAEGVEDAIRLVLEFALGAMVALPMAAVLEPLLPTGLMAALALVSILATGILLWNRIGAIQPRWLEGSEGLVQKHRPPAAGPPPEA